MFSFIMCKNHEFAGLAGSKLPLVPCLQVIRIDGCVAAKSATPARTGEGLAAAGDGLGFRPAGPAPAMRPTARRGGGDTRPARRGRGRGRGSDSSEDDSDPLCSSGSGED